MAEQFSGHGIHPRTLADVADGTPVRVRDAEGEMLDRIARTGVEMATNFPVVWVARPDEWELARREGRPPDSVPWPAEDVWLRGDEPGA